MITSAIARRYAKALIELATEEGTVEEFHDELKAFEFILTALPKSAAALSSPAVTIVAKRDLLKQIVDRLPISPTVRNFLFLLLEKNRLSQISHIIADYRAFADDLSGVLRGTLTSALPLEDPKVEELRRALEKTSGKTVSLRVEIDPSLIGGVITKIGDRVFDGSVKTQLDRIQDILQKG